MIGPRRGGPWACSAVRYGEGLDHAKSRTVEGAADAGRGAVSGLPGINFLTCGLGLQTHDDRPRSGCSPTGRTAVDPGRRHRPCCHGDVDAQHHHQQKGQGVVADHLPRPSWLTCTTLTRESRRREFTLPAPIELTGDDPQAQRCGVVSLLAHAPLAWATFDGSSRLWLAASPSDHDPWRGRDRR